MASIATDFIGQLISQQFQKKQEERQRAEAIQADAFKQSVQGFTEQGDVQNLTALLHSKEAKKYGLSDDLAAPYIMEATKNAEQKKLAMMMIGNFLSKGGVANPEAIKQFGSETAEYGGMGGITEGQIGENLKTVMGAEANQAKASEEYIKQHGDIDPHELGNQQRGINRADITQKLASAENSRASAEHSRSETETENELRPGKVQAQADTHEKTQADIKKAEAETKKTQLQNEILENPEKMLKAVTAKSQATALGSHRGAMQAKMEAPASVAYPTLEWYDPKTKKFLDASKPTGDLIKSGALRVNRADAQYVRAGQDVYDTLEQMRKIVPKLLVKSSGSDMVSRLSDVARAKGQAVFYGATKKVNPDVTKWNGELYPNLISYMRILNHRFGNTAEFQALQQGFASLDMTQESANAAIDAAEDRVTNQFNDINSDGDKAFGNENKASISAAGAVANPPGTDLGD